MRAVSLALVAALGLASLALAARADEDVDAMAEGFSDDGSTIRAGPVHEWRKIEETRKRLQEAHDRARDDDAATIRLAVFEARTGHAEKAVALLSEVSAVSSFHALALYDLGLAQLRAGRIAQARATLADAAAVGTSRAEPAFALGLACERAGDDEAAFEAFEKAEKRSRGAFAATCALRAGRLREAAGQLEEALACYRRAAGHEPVPAPGLVLSLGAASSSGRGALDEGRVLLRLGRHAEAAAAFEKVLETRDDPDVCFLHGLALALSGKSANAEITRLRTRSPELAEKLAELAARPAPAPGAEPPRAAPGGAGGAEPPRAAEGKDGR